MSAPVRREVGVTPVYHRMARAERPEGDRTAVGGIHGPTRRGALPRAHGILGGRTSGVPSPGDHRTPDTPDTPDTDTPTTTATVVNDPRSRPDDRPAPRRP